MSSAALVTFEMPDLDSSHAVSQNDTTTPVPPSAATLVVSLIIEVEIVFEILKSAPRT